MGLNDIIKEYAAEQNHKPAYNEKIKAELKHLEELDKNREGRFFPVSPWVTRFVISLDDTPVSVDRLMNNDPLLRVTKGSFLFAYTPSGYKGCRPQTPYVFQCDLLGFRFCVSGPEHLRRAAQIYPEIAWMRRNTNFDDGMFGVAKKHVGVHFPFTVNFLEYAKKLYDKMELKLGSREAVLEEPGVYLSRRCNSWTFDPDSPSIKYPEQFQDKKIQAELDKLIPDSEKGE